MKKMLGSVALIFLCGCGGTTHTIQSNGQEGMSLGNGEYLFPDGKGELKAGKLTSKQPPAGTLIRNPKTKTEVLEWLKKQGVKLEGVNAEDAPTLRQYVQ
jgi:hypothetical protein